MWTQTRVFGLKHEFMWTKLLVYVDFRHEYVDSNMSLRGLSEVLLQSVKTGNIHYISGISYLQCIQLYDLPRDRWLHVILSVHFNPQVSIFKTISTLIKQVNLGLRTPVIFCVLYLILGINISVHIKNIFDKGLHLHISLYPLILK